MSADLLVLIAGALAGSLTFGVAGFSFGIVASSIWLQAFPPATVVTLVIIIPLIMNLVLLPVFMNGFAWRRVMPFVLGSTFGVPLGALVLATVDPVIIRLAIGGVLVAYALFMLRMPRLPVVQLPSGAAPAADTGIGFVGGLMSGTSGLSIIIPALWYGVRGWTKEEQRAIVQPFGIYTQAISIACLTGIVGIREGTGRLLAVAVPVSLVGMVLGLKVFRRLSGPGFNKLVLWIALLGGFLLILKSV